MGISQRIDRVTLVTEDRLTSRPPAPRSVKIELTGRCNYRCGFCALRTRKEQPKGDMDFGLFQRITKEMRDAGVEEIGLFYLGESFMAPSLLVDAIKWCKSIGIPYTFLTTNGSLCTPNSLWAVMEAGLDSLKFSVNAGDFAQFREVMGVKPALYKNALSAIRMARDIRDSYGFKTGIYASSIQYDGAQQEKMEKLLDEHVRPYVDEHYWLPLYSMGSLATERERELGYRPTAGNQGRLGALREPLPCWSAFTEGHVTADGYLSACCFDADARWKMGDLNKQTFMQAWGSPEFVKLREAHLRKDVKGTVCEQCVAYG
jgi:radical SAM protein with 4Fe4S-binding SPASM domain